MPVDAPAQNQAYSDSETAIIQSLGIHYMQYGEYRKARQLFELCHEMSGGLDKQVLILLVDAAYREGNREKFARYIKLFSKGDLVSPRVKILLLLSMYLKNDPKAFSIFQSSTGIMRT